MIKALFVFVFALCAFVALAQIGPDGGKEPIGPGSSQGSGGAPGPTPPSQPALLPAEPISPTPVIDLNFTTASYSGCTVAACLPITRTANETCYSLSSSPAVTYAAANMPCITD